MTAQGNALGNGGGPPVSPERAYYLSRPSTPFQGLAWGGLVPRALPWAAIVRPVGAQ